MRTKMPMMVVHIVHAHIMHVHIHRIRTHLSFFLFLLVLLIFLIHTRRLLPSLPSSHVLSHASAQRNTYLTGFCLFLSLVLTRTFYIILDLIHTQEEYAKLKQEVRVPVSLMRCT